MIELTSLIDFARNPKNFPDLPWSSKFIQASELDWVYDGNFWFKCPYWMAL